MLSVGKSGGEQKLSDTYVTVGRLFDRFYTVEASRNSTGLGLSIAKLLIERMGGSIGAIYNNDKLQIKIIFAK